MITVRLERTPLPIDNSRDESSTMGVPDRLHLTATMMMAETTALVALQLGHRAICIEISPAYTKEARQRIAGEFGNLDEGSLTVAAE